MLRKRSPDISKAGAVQNSELRAAEDESNPLTGLALHESSDALSILWPNAPRHKIREVLNRYVMEWWPKPEAAHKPINAVRSRMRDEGGRVNQDYSELEIARAYTTYYYASYVAQGCLALALNQSRLRALVATSATLSLKGPMVHLRCLVLGGGAMPEVAAVCAMMESWFGIRSCLEITVLDRDGGWTHLYSTENSFAKEIFRLYESVSVQINSETIDLNNRLSDVRLHEIIRGVSPHVVIAQNVFNELERGRQKSAIDSISRSLTILDHSALFIGSDWANFASTKDFIGACVQANLVKKTHLDAGEKYKVPNPVVQSDLQKYFPLDALGRPVNLITNFRTIFYHAEFWKPEAERRHSFEMGAEDIQRFDKAGMTSAELRNVAARLLEIGPGIATLNNPLDIYTSLREQGVSGELAIKILSNASLRESRPSGAQLHNNKPFSTAHEIREIISIYSITRLQGFVEAHETVWRALLSFSLTHVRAAIEVADDLNQVLVICLHVPEAMLDRFLKRGERIDSRIAKNWTTSPNANVRLKSAKALEALALGINVERIPQIVACDALSTELLEAMVKYRSPAEPAPSAEAVLDWVRSFGAPERADFNNDARRFQGSVENVLRSGALVKQNPALSLAWNDTKPYWQSASYSSADALEWLKHLRPPVHNFFKTDVDRVTYAIDFTNEFNIPRERACAEHIRVNGDWDRMEDGSPDPVSLLEKEKP